MMHSRSDSGRRYLPDDQDPFIDMLCPHSERVNAAITVERRRLPRVIVGRVVLVEALHDIGRAFEERGSLTTGIEERQEASRIR
jgi:hypothetical protein